MATRNFVAKNSPSSGAGSHKDKKYLSKNFILKHKKVLID